MQAVNTFCSEGLRAYGLDNIITGALDIDDGEIEQAARSLKAMSHPIRLKILCALGGGEVSVQEIVDKVGTSKQHFTAFGHLARKKHSDDTQTHQPGILSRRRQTHLASAEHDTGDVLRIPLLITRAVVSPQITKQ